MGHLNDVIYFLFSEDTFIFQGKDYIGELRSVSIKRDNDGSSPDWYLETVNDWVIPKVDGNSFQYFPRPTVW